MTPVVL